MSDLYTNVSVGCDPEVFIYDYTNNKFIASCGKFGGTKEEPLKVRDCWIQEDNVALEFNIIPCYNQSTFYQEVKKALKTVMAAAETQKLGIIDVSSAAFTSDQLVEPQARIFGCEPDFNAWTGEENEPIPLEVQEGPWRTAGGHVHVGYKEPSPEKTISLMRAMDVFLGLPSISLDRDGVERRKLYGKAGAFRFKPYGGEYRTLSNFWIFKDGHIKYIYNQTMKAVNFLNKGNNIDLEDSEMIQDAICTGNTKNLATLFAKYPVLEGF